MVLALHACDTATDDALARAVSWDARWILAAPCCHKDMSRQLRRHRARADGLLTEHGILRERFADVLTDAVRAALLREQGYEVEVVEFIDSAHTPRNAMIRAVHTGPPARARGRRGTGRACCTEWQVKPALATLLEAPVSGKGLGELMAVSASRVSGGIGAPASAATNAAKPGSG